MNDNSKVSALRGEEEKVLEWEIFSAYSMKIEIVSKEVKLIAIFF